MNGFVHNETMRTSRVRKKLAQSDNGGHDEVT